MKVTFRDGEEVNQKPCKENLGKAFTDGENVVFCVHVGDDSFMWVGFQDGTDIDWWTDPGGDLGDDFHEVNIELVVSPKT